MRRSRLPGALESEARRARGGPVRPATALLIAGVLLATAALAVVGQTSLDPLAKYRAADGSLHIPGSALTPDLQRLLFGGDDLRPYLNRSHYAPAPSPYATMALVEVGYNEPNPNVFTHPAQPRESLAGAIAHLLSRWFPPVDWTAPLRAAADGFFGLFTLNARASVVLDSTTVTDVLLKNQASVTAPNDGNSANNSASKGTTIIACFDVTGDSLVRVGDIIAVIQHYGAEVGQPNYDLLFDFNGDGVITITDILYVIQHYGVDCV